MTGQLQISDNLSQWLDLSWFYPEGFKKQAIEHNSRFCTVVGESLSYRFHKHPSDCPIRDKLEGCRNELQLNKELAPDLYLGAKLLKWVDGEPHWFTQQISSLDRFVDSMFEAEEIGLVLRTIEPDDILSLRLSTVEDVSPRFIPKISRLLKEFYQRRKREGVRKFLKDPDESVAFLQDRYLRRLGSIKPRDEFGDFCNGVISYASGRLQTELLKSRPLLMRRGSAGKLVEIHGNLCCDNVCLERLCQSGKQINIFGRHERVFGDVLEDIADLYVDLQALGHRSYAELLKKEFLEPKNDDEERLFRLFISLKSLSRVVSELSSKSISDIDLRSLLSTCFLNLLGVKQPLVICLEQDALTYLPVISAFLDSSLLLEDKESEFLSNYWVRQDQKFLRTLQHVDAEVSKGSNVVLGNAVFTKEHKISLAHNLERLGARLIFLQADESKAVLDDDIYGFTNIVSNGLGSTEHWNLSKKEVPHSEAWELVLDFLIQALGKQ